VDLRKNRLRELVQQGLPSLGTRITVSWPTLVEVIGYTRQFDYVEFLAEYAPYDLYTLENLGRALELQNMSGMIKIQQDSRMHLAVRAAMSGFQNFLFADVRTVDDVKECVNAVRAEAPEAGGLRGVAQGRDVGVVLDAGSPAFVQSTLDAMVVLMIEKKEAVENLESLLAVPGVDMVQFGPTDYSMSIGMAGQSQHPQVWEAQVHMIKTAQKMGITPRAELKTPADAEKFLKLGVRHFCLGTDHTILYSWLNQNGSAMRELFKGL
jgi:2-keto-3-deoxy-L-rhamnonate aldolase RhmA